ncbi:MAG TPA: wax ester/triacylglycerol synthase domain-containing protein, partial [Acidimicrobiales bacterium]|nr:wax ester/triacylglycerol synthase domain-containing protein [Acidimicrobiales bacterium]
MAEVRQSQVGVDTMSGSDALLWTISADPVLRPTIVAVVVLGGRPEWGEVRERVARLTVMVPRLRSRVVPRPPGLGRPRFVPDDGFNLSDHLRRARLPENGGLRDVLDLAQTMATTGFDSALPLWEAVLVEEVDGDRAAVVLKVHHALIDGVGGLAVLAHLFDGLGFPGGAEHPGQAAPSRGRARTDLPELLHLAGSAADALVHPFRSAG